MDSLYFFADGGNFVVRDSATNDDRRAFNRLLCVRWNEDDDEDDVDNDDERDRVGEVGSDDDSATAGCILRGSRALGEGTTRSSFDATRICMEARLCLLIR